MSLPVLLVEDEPALARRLEQQLVACWPGIDILPHADNGAAAVALALEHLPRVIFLDIHMPACSGLDAAQAIIEDWPDTQPLPQLVFVTAYPQYALQAFEQAAIDYLLKPVGTERLHKTVQRLQQRLAADAQPPDGLHEPLSAELGRLMGTAQPVTVDVERLTRITATVGTVTHLIPIRDVLYFETADKYLRVVTRQRDALIRMTLRDLLARLDPAAFWQIHRSMVVGVEHVSHVERTDDGRLQARLHGHPARLTVSRLFAHRFRSL